MMKYEDLVNVFARTAYRAGEGQTTFLSLPGMFLKKGSPKSLYRPGSSTDILIFQKGRMEFAGDIVFNLGDRRVANRSRGWFNDSLVETEVSAFLSPPGKKYLPKTMPLTKYFSNIQTVLTQERYNFSKTGDVL